MTEDKTNKPYHILKGDSLKKQFPKALKGNVFVARECLVDGEVTGDSPEELFACRAAFITKYGIHTEADYLKLTVAEFERIQNIPYGAEINLWFEDDLFCQVNLWFTIFVLSKRFTRYAVYLVRPMKAFEYNFGGMSESELIEAFRRKTRIEIGELQQFGQLWINYGQDNRENLIKIAKGLATKYPFLIPAIDAHIDRKAWGRPKKTIAAIIDELETDECGPVFQEFCRRERIYGFGDLQVKRLLDETKL